MPTYDRSFFAKQSNQNPTETLENIVSLKECVIDITMHAISEFSNRRISEELLEARLAELDKGSYEVEVDGEQNEAIAEAKKFAGGIRAILGQKRLIAHQLVQEWLMPEGSDPDSALFPHEELPNSISTNLFMEFAVLSETFINLVTQNSYSIINGLNYVAHELIYLIETKYEDEDSIKALGIDMDKLRECAHQLNNYDESSTSDVVATMDFFSRCHDCAEYMDFAACSIMLLGNIANTLVAQKKA